MQLKIVKTYRLNLHRRSQTEDNLMKTLTEGVKTIRSNRQKNKPSIY